MKKLKVISFILVLILCGTFNIYGVSSDYINTTVNNANVKYVVVDMNNSMISTKILNAGNQMTTVDSLSNMASGVGAFAAINGTYFEAYNGTPVPWGTLIRDGKVIHISNGGSVAGITNEGKLIIDRLSFEFKGYINDVYRAIPWRINHPSNEGGAITLFTPEYGVGVTLETGAKAVLVNKEGKVSEITNYNFTVPTGGFAIVYNSDVVNLVDERYKVGDSVRYEVIIKTIFTNEEDWANVVNAVGAGPSLIINGQVTADGVAEGFFEAKINTNAVGRSFIGANSEGKIMIGNMGAVTIKQAAEIAKNLGLVNAMCLDGGGSIALYYPTEGINTGGRKINNGLAFIEEKIQGELSTPTSSKVLVNGKEVQFDAYNIKDNNYFKLRDLAYVLKDSKSKFNVLWDNDRQAINLISNKVYEEVGGELAKGDGRIKGATKNSSAIYKDGKEINMTAYNINGNNYFKLRDLGAEFGFEVNWNQETSTIEIVTK